MKRTKFLKRPGVIAMAFAVAFIFAALVGSEARGSADAAAAGLVRISGIVRDGKGQPVSGLKLSFTDWFGGVWGSAVTDLKGRYAISGIQPGHYYMRVRPLDIPGRGQLYDIHVPNRSIRLNLTLRLNVSAIALAPPADSLRTSRLSAA